MGKLIDLPGGGYATTEESATALELEARRRKISYGRLVGNTTEQERTEIIRQYCVRKRRRGKKGG
jgi:hypothetical protein